MELPTAWLWMIGAALLGSCLVSFVVLKDASARSASQVVALQARMRYQQSSLSPNTSVETVTLGWLNILLKYMWPGFLSNIANSLAQDQLASLFEKLSESLKDKPIFRVAFAEMSLRELSLGCLPPELENGTARIMPKEQTLELEMDLNWITSGFHFVLDSKVNMSQNNWNIKVQMHDLAIRGRILMVLKLSKTLLPGVEGFQFTFVRKPEITFDLDLRGMLFSEVPGLNREIQKRLVTIISNEAVEPARIWIDMKTPFYNLVTRKQTGRRGQLKITVQRCTDVKPTCDKGSPDATKDTEEVMLFLELQGLHKAMVSPVATQGSAPEFDWAFYMPLESVPSTDGKVSVRFIARNFLAKKQPQVIGEGVLRLDSFTSEQLTRAEPHPARLKLKSPKGKSGGGGTLHLLLSWVKEAPKLSKAPDPPPASAQPNTAKKVQPPQGERRAYPKQGLQTLPEGDEEGHDAGHESDGDSDGDDSDGQDGHVDTQQANNAEDSSDGDGGGGGGGSGGGGGGRRRSTGAARSPSNRSFESGSGYQRSRYGANGDMAVLAAAIHSDDGFDQGASGTHAAAAAKRRVKELEQVIKTEMDRRHEEELRALLEGAPFIMHRGSDKLTRHVWVADVPAEKKAVMRWQSYKGKQWRKLTPGGDHVKFAKEQYHEAAVSLITSVTYGHDLFPEVQASHHKARHADPPSHDKCFSILLKVRAENGEERTVAVHLEVPPYGNGRSRNEWVSAFNSLMCRKLPIYKKESPAQSDDDEDE